MMSGRRHKEEMSESVLERGEKKKLENRNQILSVVDPMTKM